MSVAELVASSRSSQGLPPTIQEPSALARVAQLLTSRQEGLDAA